MSASDLERSVPAPVLDAMREWAAGRFGPWMHDEDAFPTAKLTQLVEDHYPSSGRPKVPGGVVAFLRDHGNEGGEER